jgi:hypothetical protein
MRGMALGGRRRADLREGRFHEEEVLPCPLAEGLEVAVELPARLQVLIEPGHAELPAVELALQRGRGRRVHAGRWWGGVRVGCSCMGAWADSARPRRECMRDERAWGLSGRGERSAHLGQREVGKLRQRSELVLAVNVRELLLQPLRAMLPLPGSIARGHEGDLACYRPVLLLSEC